MSVQVKFFLSALICWAALLVLVPGSDGFCQELTIQVLSSADTAAAEKMRDSLQKDGLDAYISRHEAEGAVVYRVRIGRFASRKNAEQVQEALRAKGIQSWLAPADGESPAQQKTPAAENNEPEKDTAPPSPAPEPPATTSLPVPDVKPAAAADTAAKPAENASRQEAGAAAAAADTKIFELVINPEPTFSDQQAPATTSTPAATTSTTIAATTSTTTTPPCRPDKYYFYFDPRDATLHIAAALDKIPALYQKQLRQIIIFPVYFRQMNLQDMSIQVELEEKTAVIALDGITQAQQPPSRQAVRDFESALRENPLRILYYPPRTEPDGTLHGALFFKSGLSVEQEMVRRGLAAGDSAQPAP